MNLKRAHALNTMEQKEVNGGRPPGCQVGCAGKSHGDSCYHSAGCSCPGQCNSHGCVPY
jgi:hypothetical protein